MRMFLGILGAGFVVAACSTNPQPAPLSGSADIQALEGEWIGEYHSYETGGRSGTILFRLEADQDTARGDVLLHVAGGETASVIPFTTDPWDDVSPDQLLTVRFVRGPEGAILGRVDTYNDPVCGCEVRTTLTGRIQGNLFEGTYTTEHLTGADRTHGRWRVVRTFPD